MALVKYEILYILKNQDTRSNEIFPAFRLVAFAHFAKLPDVWKPERFHLDVLFPAYSCKIVCTQPECECDFSDMGYHVKRRMAIPYAWKVSIPNYKNRQEKQRRIVFEGICRSFKLLALQKICVKDFAAYVWAKRVCAAKSLVLADLLQSIVVLKLRNSLWKQSSAAFPAVLIFQNI